MTAAPPSDKLCTLLVSFTDASDPKRAITTTHTFDTSNPFKYPQSRKVVYKSGSRSMSSPPYMDDSDGDYARPRSSRNIETFKATKPDGTKYEKMIVQEVSLGMGSRVGTDLGAYPIGQPLSVHLGQGPPRVAAIGSFSTQQHHAHQHSHQSHLSQDTFAIDRVSPISGRHETEFPVRIAYVGGDQVIPYRAVPVERTSSTHHSPAGHDHHRIRRHSQHGSLITETTHEEYRAYSTRRIGEDTMSSQASVSELARQFDQQGRREESRDVRSRSSSRLATSPPGSTLVLVSKNSGDVSLEDTGDSRVRRVHRAGYSPSDQRAVLQTTIVDIDGGQQYRRSDTDFADQMYQTRGRSTTPKFVEETIQVQEEYRSIKTYGGAGGRGAETEYRSEQTMRDGSGAVTRHHIDSGRVRAGGDTRDDSLSTSLPSPPVRSVVEQFEHRIEEVGRRRRPSTEHSSGRSTMERDVRTETRSDARAYEPRDAGARTYTEVREALRAVEPREPARVYTETREVEELVRTTRPQPVPQPVPQPAPRDTTPRTTTTTTTHVDELVYTTRVADRIKEVEEKEKSASPEPREVYVPRAPKTPEPETYVPKRPAAPPAPAHAPREVYIPAPKVEPKVEPREVYIPKEPKPEPKPEPREVYIPKEPKPEPKPEPKMVEIPKAVETPRKDERSTYEEKTTRFDAWEEVTSSWEKRDRERKEKEQREEMEKARKTVTPPPRSPPPKYTAPKSPTLKKSTEFDSTTKYASSTIDSGISSSRMSDLPEYRSSISARPAFNRTLNNFNTSSSTTTTTYGGISGNRVLKIVNEVGSSGVSAMSPYGQNAASTIRDSREREKKEMSDLNDRLASYIEKVRFLEAQNRKLSNDLDLLRSRWGKDTSSVRAMYESELTEAKKVIDDTNKTREDLEREIRKLMEELAEYRRKYEDALRSREGDRARIDDLLQKLSALEAEINLLKRRVSNLEDEVTRIKKENQRLMGELQRSRNDLDQETLNRIDYQNQVQTLLEEIDFIKRVQDQEIRDLQALASRDTTPENREYFKNELASAIRDIRQEYDQVSSVNRTDMESWYKLKVQEIQTQSTRVNMEQGYAKEEVKRLRTQLSDLRGKLADLEARNSLLEKQTQELNYQLEDDQRSYEAALNDRDAQIRKMREECQALMVELQMLLDTKQTLDAEIAIYRKMLEGEENRAGLRQLVEQVVKTHGFSSSEETESMRVVKGETASRTSFQRSAKGNVSIHETSADGKFVVLENTHRSREENIGDWKLKRKIDGKNEIVYTLPSGFVLRPGKSVKIFARGHGSANPPETLVMDEESFGQGSNVHTTLYNVAGEERATHIQRVSHN